MALLLMTAGIAIAPAAEQANNTPPKELVQYIHEAKRSGTKEDKIRKQALALGWPAASVEQAIAYEKSGETSQPPSPTAVTASPQEPKLEPGEVPAAAPLTRPAHALGEGTNAVGAVANPKLPQDYRIAAGDTLQISVWKEQEVSVPSEIVRPDGKVTVPLIKEVEVAGLTPKQVETAVTERLAKFISNANVTVVITAMGAKSVYVTGEVKKEGPVPFVYGMSVIQAISEAGGLTDFAKRKKVYILRTENGRASRLDIKYNEVVKGIRMEQNIQLVPSDTVVVP